MNLPLIVGGYADSTFGNSFAGRCHRGECDARHREIGHRVHGRTSTTRRTGGKNAKGKGVGFFQIGGGIAGDFPICVVPSIKYDLQAEGQTLGLFLSDS